MRPAFLNNCKNSTHTWLYKRIFVLKFASLLRFQFMLCDRWLVHHSVPRGALVCAMLVTRKDKWWVVSFYNGMMGYVRRYVATLKTFLGVLFLEYFGILLVSSGCPLFKHSCLITERQGTDWESKEALPPSYRHYCSLSDMYFYFNIEVLTALWFWNQNEEKRQ